MGACADRSRKPVDRSRALAHYAGERTKVEAALGNVAWFAPRGVPMVAMTQERIAALRSIATSGSNPALDDVLRGMLTAAGDEVSA